MKNYRDQSSWRRQTPLERRLIQISIAAGITVICLVIACVTIILINKKTEALECSKEAPEEELRDDVIYVPIHPNEVNDDICLTPGCVHTSSKVLETMDQSVEPCNDFYKFACGTFLKNTNIPDEKVLVDTFSLIDDKLEEQLRSIISEEIREDEPKPFKLAKKLYKACMNQTLIEQRGIQPIVDIAEKLGGWPVVKGDSWDEASWTWQESIQNFRKIGFSLSYILALTVFTDSKNSSRRIIYLDESYIGLDRKYLMKGFDDKIVQAYYSHMVDMSVMFGANRTLAEAELKDSLNFEINLANISLSSEARRNSSALYHPMSIWEIQEKYPYVQWIDYINALLPEGLVINEDEIVIITEPSFFEGLGEILENTPKRTIANYLMWRIHKFSSFLLTEDLSKRQLQFEAVVIGRHGQKPRWKECSDITIGRYPDFVEGLPIAVGAQYVQKYFQENAKSQALEMVNGIRKEFEFLLEEIPWMDNETRKSALNKLETMSTHIGYPDEILDIEKLEKYYADLEIDPDMYLESILQIKIFETNFLFNGLRKPNNKTDWIEYAKPAVVNAYYSASKNSIEFPAGILQGMFFSADRPKYMNYGAIGYVIGHEITHGFDDHGRQFDLDGNLVDWWQEGTKSAYLEKTRCIIQQYGNFTDSKTNLNLNGEYTQGENIADNGGIKESYLAYKRWASNNKPEPRLPGLDYTPQQMFWISAAQVWCSKYTPESLEQLITTGEHSPSEFRVLGPMSNMQDFANDFSCPEDTLMNPKHKCEVW